MCLHRFVASKQFVLFLKSVAADENGCNEEVRLHPKLLFHQFERWIRLQVALID